MAAAAAAFQRGRRISCGIGAHHGIEIVTEFGEPAMPRRFLLIGILLMTFPISYAAPQRGSLEAGSWARKLADSELKRQGDALIFGKNPKARWTYETGVFLKGLEAVSDRTGDSRYHDYVKSVIDSFLEPDGTIRTYKLEDYNLDNINCGKLLLTLFQKTGDEKYRSAAFLLRKQLEQQPRTKEGGFWHKQIYPYQMWLDGIYMASPFLAQFSSMFNKPGGFDDVAHQILWIEAHTRDSRTGLLYHGWDESRQQEWADPKTGRSKSFWGRAMGWYAMGIVDVLEFLPETHPQRAALVKVLERLCRAVRTYQDRDSGLWYQVVDQGKREKNYLEASASSMFVYAMAKGVRKGYLSKAFVANATKGYEGLIKRLIKVDPDGSVHLTQICSVGGLGGAQKRDGTFAYYMSEPVVVNDLKGVGAFIMAGVELDRLVAGIGNHK
jgi:unsaturated rhamnogalacturonyl hydrolase